MVSGKAWEIPLGWTKISCPKCVRMQLLHAISNGTQHAPLILKQEIQAMLDAQLFVVSLRCTIFQVYLNIVVEITVTEECGGNQYPILVS